MTELKSESVWFKQVDSALLTYISSLFPKLYTFVRKPDEDFKIEKYPCIGIYALSYIRNPLRYNGNKLTKLEFLEEDSFLILEKPAVPYDLTYQIDFWSLTQESMNNMTRIWLGNCPEGYINLDLEDFSGNRRNSFMRQVGSITKSDLLNGSDRIFHTILTYNIWVEIDERITTKKHYIKTIDVKGRYLI